MGNLFDKPPILIVIFLHITNDQTVLFLTIQFNTSHFFALNLNASSSLLYVKTVLFDPNIGPFLVLPFLGQSPPGSDCNEGVLQVPQSTYITGTTPSACLVS